MKYKEQTQLVEDLRELADLIEAKGHKMPIDMSYNALSLSQFLYGDEAKPGMVKVAKNIGKAEKDYGEHYFDITRKMTHGMVVLKFSTSRSQVCTKKVVGIEKVEKKAYVTIPGEYEDKEIIEWECDPVFS